MWIPNSVPDDVSGAGDFSESEELILNGEADGKIL